MSALPVSPKGAIPHSRCLSIVLPAYNEAGTIGEIVASILAQPLVQEIIAVDDGSTDRTWEQLQAVAKQEVRVKLLRHQHNQGKGAVLRMAFAQVTAPVVLVQDADLEYDPRDYPALVQPIVDGKADVVFGSRFDGGGAHRVLYFWHYVGNRLLTTFSNMCTNLNLTDMEVGLKAFRREILEQICLEECRFGFEPEVIAKVCRIEGVRIYEVPVSYYGRTYAEGKKPTWRDGVSALRCIVRYNLLRRRRG
jgi:glycosyltransferase involved in cell wall biosynthesis